jgi:hypothetical protein
LPAVVFYVSGHGFGHASRQVEIINALGALRPDLTIIVRTSAPRWLFDRTTRVPITLMPGACDTGVVQIDSLRLDEGATIHRARDFYRTLPERAQQESQLLKEVDARLVIVDAPPLGCAAAAAAGVPSVVISNFTWDWIYEAYTSHLADAPELLPAIRNAYRRADLAWRLPMHGGFTSFDTIVDVPFVARHATHDRAHVRRTLGLPLHRPLVLSSFGGYGVSGLDVTRLDCLTEYGVVLTTRDANDTLGNPPAGIYEVTEGALYGSGLRYEDLVAACDVVATKPGYGIIAECIANGAAMLYTSRGRFVEYDVMVAEMPQYLRCGFVDHDALFGGRWRRALDEVLSAPAPARRAATDGALVLSREIASGLPS